MGNGTVLVSGGTNRTEVYDYFCVPVPTTTTLVGARKLGNGSFQCGFTNCPGASFAVLATTNPALPLCDWTLLGGVTEICAGQFQFNDPQATNSPQRFYRLRSQ